MSTQATRTVTVFATKGKRKAKIETNATKWSELRSLISNEGYDVNNLHATENVRRSDLAHADAALPEGDFTVFLRPKKTKSGGKDYNSMGFKELRAELTEEDKEAIVEFSGGKNWTRCSTQDLKDYLNQKTESASTTEEAEEVEEVTETATEEAAQVPGPVTNSDRIASIETLLSEIGADCDSEEVDERISIVNDEIAGLKEAIASCDEDAAAKLAEEKARKEAEEAEARENDELANEAKDLMSGF